MKTTDGNISGCTRTGIKYNSDPEENVKFDPDPNQNLSDPPDCNTFISLNFKSIKSVYFL